MKEKQEDRIESLSILNRTSGIGIEVLFCNISHKAYISIAAVDYERRIKNAVYASERLKEPSSFEEAFSTYSGAFTATLVKHPGKFHLVFSAPDLALPSGEKGIKAELTLPAFDSNTFTADKDGWKFSCVSPLTVEGRAYINHQPLLLSRDNTLGLYTNLSGDFRGKELSATACTLMDENDIFWGYVSHDRSGLVMRSEINYPATLKEEVLFEFQEKVPKGHVNCSYLRLTGSFEYDNGERRQIKPCYGVRTSFLI